MSKDTLKSIAIGLILGMALVGILDIYLTWAVGELPQLVAGNETLVLVSAFGIEDTQKVSGGTIHYRKGGVLSKTFATGAVSSLQGFGPFGGEVALFCGEPIYVWQKGCPAATTSVTFAGRLGPFAFFQVEHLEQ